MEFVKLLAVFSVLAISAADPCYQAPDPGPCLAYMPRFYYNPGTRTCEQFIYGGCPGNSNNFQHIEECMSRCKDKSKRSDTESTMKTEIRELLGSIDKRYVQCSMPPETGPCRGYFPRFYYNPGTRTCHEFIYGGCLGNPNNFETMPECMNQCRGARKRSDTESTTEMKTRGLLSSIEKRYFPCDQPKDPGPCLAYIPRFFYNQRTRTCEQFIYGGCAGNPNNFHHIEECMDRCKYTRKRSDTESTIELEISNLLSSIDKRISSVCYLSRVVGPCKAAFPRYYYDTVTGVCKRFTYGGCGGNGNNFKTMAACRSTCH